MVNAQNRRESRLYSSNGANVPSVDFLKSNKNSSLRFSDVFIIPNSLFAFSFLFCVHSSSWLFEYFIIRWCNTLHPCTSISFPNATWSPTHHWDGFSMYSLNFCSRSVNLIELWTLRVDGAHFLNASFLSWKIVYWTSIPNRSYLKAFWCTGVLRLPVLGDRFTS